MKVDKIKYSNLDLWDPNSYGIKRELESSEQYYCNEVYSELCSFIDDHKDLKRFMDCGVLLLRCSEFDCSSFGSKIKITDLYQKHNIILEFLSDYIILTKQLISNPELNDTAYYTVYYPLSHDGISSCIGNLKYKILPELNLILSKDSRYLFKTASLLLEKEFGTENFNVGCFYPNDTTIYILHNPGIYIDFDVISSSCSVSLYGSGFKDTLPSSFTTIDEWEKYLAELANTYITNIKY